jgi:CRP-like cAMP-binding protein
VLREGELFGEACLSGSAKRTADVFVEGKLVALRFSRVLLDRIAPQAPTLERVLVEALGRRVLASAIASSKVFAPLSAAERREAGLLFDLRRAVPRFPLLSKGKTSDALYVVISDEIEVEDASGKKQLVGAGGVVGEKAVVSPGPSDVTALAPRGAIVLQLTAAKLAKLAAMRPALGKHLASLRIETNAGPQLAAVS